jgi:CO/xanthine dehydrogenase FAD-binding subunit
MAVSAEATMRAFEYVRATGVREAVAAVTADPAAAFLAGGTTQVDLMRDGVLGPDLLVDISAAVALTVADGEIRTVVRALSSVAGMRP